MNREIKFRVWDKYDKRWSKVRNLLLDRNGESTFYTLTDKALDRFIFQQFTGFKDKNGKEIYEGDIVECNSHMLAVIQPNPIIGIIEFSKGNFIINDKSLKPTFPMSSFLNNNYYNIIGNIYENPNLIQ
jgi:uncharacterized phage protein (TIGR01671 family)